MIKKRIENTYGRTMRGLMVAVNPIKKKIMKTHCMVHKFINMQGIEILKNDGYTQEYQFFKQHVKALNEGVTWADQDFKSPNHFYHLEKGRGLYGFSSALAECEKYYRKAIHLAKGGDLQQALFYFGAACHLIQDATVPHHGSNKLLDRHRRFELWIISKLMNDYSFEIHSGTIEYGTLEEYIKSNAKFARQTYLVYSHIKEQEERYYKTASIILEQAQKTTAGFMLFFHRELHENNSFYH